ncbi:MAG: hypothetical protein HY927_06675 [Elusimicrobia bacterium]|nr:hypothetical protein [Elusimicrobiota bacterium]
MEGVQGRFKKTVAMFVVASLLASQQGLFVSEAVAQVVTGQTKAGPATPGGVTGLPSTPQTKVDAAASLSPVTGLSLGGLPAIPAPKIDAAALQPFQGRTGLPTAPAGLAPGGQAVAGANRSPLAADGPAPSLKARTPPARTRTSLAAPIAAPAEEAAKAAPQTGQPRVNAPVDDTVPDAAPVGDYVAEGLRRAQKVTERVPLQAEAAFLNKTNYDEPISYPIEYPADAPNALAEVSLEPDPGVRYTPSPESWSDQTIYFPLIDRFAKGEGAKPVGDPRNGRARHGGNLKGLIDKLDYIKEAGFTTLLINPVFLNAPDGYHGYSPLHFMGIDPHLGTMADFKRLVQEAHKRGMYVIFDLAINHAGAVFEYKGSAEWEGMDKPAKEIDHWNYELFPKELKDPRHFSRRGVLNNWDDEAQKVNADFPPYQRRFDTRNPETQDMLIQVAKWWLRETDVDGFRLDAYKHIAPEFWARFHREVQGYASKLGKKDLFRPGEILTHRNEEIAGAMGPDGINGAYNYPAYLKDLDALQGRAPTRIFEESLAANLRTLGDATLRMIRFLDTQDTYRFLSESAPLKALWTALAYVLFSTGIPLIYYGTEQAFRQAHVGHYDPRNREDMFADGQYKSQSSAGDKFDQGSPTYQYMRRLMGLRKDIPALRRGGQFVRWADQNGPGIYAFSRIYQGEEVLVVINTAAQPRSATMWVDNNLSPPGTELRDQAGSDYSVRTHAPEGGGSKVSVDIPAYGVRVLRRPAK